MLESVAANTNVILPPQLMEGVTNAIKRDGLALARAPAYVDKELSKYAGTDPIEVLKFRVTCFPDTRSWKILEVCILSIVQLLDSRIRHSKSIRSNTRPGPELIVYENTEVNVYRDILLALLRRAWKSMMEIDVSPTLS
jgi:hypothetical protein